MLHEPHVFASPVNTAGFVKLERRGASTLSKAAVGDMQDEIVGKLSEEQLQKAKRDQPKKAQVAMRRQEQFQRASTKRQTIIIDPTLTLEVLPSKTIQRRQPVPIAPRTLEHIIVPPKSSQSRTSLWRRKKAEVAGSVSRYKRKKAGIRCAKCGFLRDSTSGHSQYKGRVYCPNSERHSKEEWLKTIKSEIGKKV